ncbi:MAG: hypothetical protein JSV66_00180 [Trueperaceae bacterium]|nr:MAG: hypothetical protein JSV66_00180 [Trueperaceae bacterium]
MAGIHRQDGETTKRRLRKRGGERSHQQNTQRRPHPYKRQRNVDWWSEDVRERL